MLSGKDLKEFKKLSKDDTIAVAYGALPQIRELILALDEIDKETYEQLYQFLSLIHISAPTRRRGIS